MTLDIVNAQNEKIGSVQLRDELFGRRPHVELMWEAVVHQNAGERRGTHATKTRGLVSGSGRKPWRQKGTGRARVGEIRNPLWRKGGTVFGPQPRSYTYSLPRKMALGALRSALAVKIQGGDVIVIDRLAVEEAKTKATVELLQRLGVTGKAVIVDVKPDERLTRSGSNLSGVRVVPAGRLTARDVLDARRLVVTTAALERLQAALEQ